MVVSYTKFKHSTIALTCCKLYVRFTIVGKNIQKGGMRYDIAAN
jgi:hypothetical protein